MADAEADTTQRPTKRGAPPHTPSNAYATAWACHWTDPALGLFTKEDLQLLEHVNCSYLSSGKAPTLLALKQHAQSLANLIKRLSVSATFGIVDRKNARPLPEHQDGERRPIFKENEAFDWLNDLDEPYSNEDEYHYLPLWAIVNHVEAEEEVEGPVYHCPLKKVPDFGPRAEENESCQPYGTHLQLAMHANECLEILDHEYGATGGLISLLPTDEDDKSQMAGIRNCILGQWLLHHQHLIARMHELEINYANALDLLNGEAVVPMQMMAQRGPDGLNRARELAYPQDRFVLANAGDDVFNMLHRILDRQEALIEPKQNIWWESGVSGERMWMQKRGGDWYSRGMVPIDLKTRFYRIKDQGSRSTIFMLPAFDRHPGVNYTRKIEARPSVVSVIAPSKVPQQLSQLEKSLNERYKDLVAVEATNAQLRGENEQLKAELEVSALEVKHAQALYAAYEEFGNGDNDEREEDEEQCVEDRDMTKKRKDEHKLVMNRMAELQVRVGELRERLKRLRSYFPEEYDRALKLIGVDEVLQKYEGGDAVE